jgi:hypothetical protein
MAKEKHPKKDRADKYEEKLKVNLSFDQILQAAANNANKKSAKKKD